MKKEYRRRMAHIVSSILLLTFYSTAFAATYTVNTITNVQLKITNNSNTTLNYTPPANVDFPISQGAETFTISGTGVATGTYYLMPSLTGQGLCEFHIMNNIENTAIILTPLGGPCTYSVNGNTFEVTYP